MQYLKIVFRVFFRGYTRIRNKMHSQCLCRQEGVRGSSGGWFIKSLLFALFEVSTMSERL